MGLEGVTRSEGTPEDRLGRISATMIATAEQHPEASGEERMIIMLFDGDKGGIGIAGYDEDPEMAASIDLFLHLAAMFGAQGKKLSLMGEDGVVIL